MSSQTVTEKLQEAPTNPGCYIWKDSHGDVLYVGKAVNIKNRVNSYINNYKRLDPKIQNMVDLADDVEFYTVDTEIEALILETNLIKKYKPKYNRLMKDDKNYSWLMIDWYNPYPVPRIVREKKNKKAEYYGPYPQRFPVFKVLRSLRKVFPYCNHLPRGINSKKNFQDKPCFNYHIGLCSGICAGIISKTEHRKNIKGIRDFFKGKKLTMIDEFRADMKKFAQEMQFEKAAELRDKVKDLEYVTQHIKVDKDMDEEALKKMKKDLRERALDELLEKLQLDNSAQFKIECYDISNIQGTNATGSMVVFVDGKPDKALYRKFKIKTKSTPDDFHMMREVLTRRLKYLSGSKSSEKNDKSFSIQPDLIIVDGGKGQLTSAYSILNEYGLIDSVPLIGLAKREEEIFRVIDTEPYEFEKIRLKRRSEALYLIQRIRDEAHRFAIGYHRTLRSKGQIKSILDDIPGVGEITKKRLFEAFGSVESMKKATNREMEAIVRNKRTSQALLKVLKKV
ncbi:excinuclease ABC subunit UvrC [Candidatus Dojkabacteria bacterium]|uniref:Excinuclease ABC subunit UvrC n=1 Tax=Candidatus Dojkabacteria bacterium TaxID=2099670 RepID=A0A955RL49_9BACT|nr:excinuclease ABC subunit UvrC [Candidatus Dojkabacteria bacterium]